MTKNVPPKCRQNKFSAPFSSIVAFGIAILTLGVLPHIFAFAQTDEVEIETSSRNDAASNGPKINDVNNARSPENADDSNSFNFADTANWSELDAPPSETSLQFRVDNVVRFVENEREISLKTSTVFYDDLAFDFIGDNGEIIVYSFAARKFALIDPIRRLRTEVSVDEIDRFLENVEPRLKARKNGFCDFMLAPEFDVSQKENELLFQSRWIDYRAGTRLLENRQILKAYYRFSDDLCKLNIFMNPGAITPFARRAVNRRLEEDSRFPEKIVVDIYPKGKMFFNKAIQAVNEHKIAFRASEKDRNRAMRAIHFAAQFPEVNFLTYYSKINEK